MMVRVCALALLCLCSGRARADNPVVDPEITLATRCAPRLYAERARDDLWMADSCGAVFHSGDSGKSWSPSPPVFSDKQELIGLLWPSEASGMAVARSGKVAIAAAGSGWRLSGRAFDGVSAMARAGANVWVCDGAGKLARTSTAGATWVDLPSPLDRACGALAFADAKNGWLAPAVEGNAPPTLLRGWVSASRAAPVLWRTSDGGKTWRKAAPLPGRLDSITFALVTPAVGWLFAVGAERHQVFRSSDGGDSWRESDVPSPQEGHLRAAEARHLWLSGFDLAERASGGSPVPSEAAAPLDDQKALIVQDGVPLLFNGTVVRPMLPMTPGSERRLPLSGVYIHSGAERWGWGDKLLFRSDDNGASWYRWGEAPETITAFTFAGAMVYVQGPTGRYFKAPRDLSRWDEVKTTDDRIALMLARATDDPIIKNLSCITRAPRGELILDRSSPLDGETISGRITIRWSSSRSAVTGDIEKLGGGKGERQLSSGVLRAALRSIASIVPMGRRKCADNQCEISIVRWTCDKSPEQVYAERSASCDPGTPCKSRVILDAALRLLPPAKSR